MNIKLLILTFIGVCFFTGAWQLSLVGMEKEITEKSQSKFEQELNKNPQSRKAFEICVNLIAWSLEKFFKSWNEHQKQAGLKELIHDIKYIKSYYIGQQEQSFYEAIFICCTLVQFFCIEKPAMKYLLSDITFLHAISIKDLATFIDENQKYKKQFDIYWLSHEKIKKLLSFKAKQDKCQLHMSVDSDAYSSVYSDTGGLKKDSDEISINLSGDEDESNLD